MSACNSVDVTSIVPSFRAMLVLPCGQGCRKWLATCHPQVVQRERGVLSKFSCHKKPSAIPLSASSPSFPASGTPLGNFSDRAGRVFARRRVVMETRHAFLSS